MSPDDVAVVWPSAEEIAKAAFAAARLEGCDPIDILNGFASARPRAYALLAVAWQYPTAPRRPLSRKFGNEQCATGARQALVKNAWAWFSLDRLNEVRRELGWPGMTLEDAKAAPLLYHGRPFSEFLPRSASDSELPGAEAAPIPVAGSGAEKEPASISSSMQDDNPPAGCSGDLGRPSIEKGADAGPSAEEAPAIIQSSDGGVERHAGSAAYVGPCDVGTRLAASTGTVPELEAERAETGAGSPNPPPRPNRPVSEKARALRVEGQSHNAGMTPRPPAGMLAGRGTGPSDTNKLAAVDKTARLVVAPPVTVDKTAKTSPAPSAPRGIARRMSDGPIEASPVTSFRPDPPAELRGMTIVEIPGTPPLGRSALDKRNARLSK